MSGLVHIAAEHVILDGRLLRQRCAWCGTLLIDYDLERLQVPVVEGEEARGPSTWPAGALVEVDGNASWLVPHEDGAELPANACAQLDAEVTV